MGSVRKDQRWLPGAAVTKYHSLGAETAETYSLSVWRPEVCTRGVSRAVLSLKAPGEDPALPLPGSGGCRQPLACGCVTPVFTSVFTRSSPRASVRLQFLTRTPVAASGPTLIQPDLI